MTRPKLLAVFALVDEAASSFVRLQQGALMSLTNDSTALRFPVHFTVRGRFWADPNAAWSCLSRLPEYAEIAAEQILFVGPKCVGELVWLEAECTHRLGRLERAVDNRLRHIIVQDEVSAAHKSNGYRPHITLGWNAPAPIQAEFNRNRLPTGIAVRVTKIVLVEYPVDWRNHGNVRTIRQARLRGASAGSIEHQTALHRL